MDYANTLSAVINRNNRSGTGGNFALIRTVTGGEQAIKAKGDSGRRKRAGGFESGFAGALGGAPYG